MINYALLEREEKMKKRQAHEICPCLTGKGIKFTYQVLRLSGNDVRRTIFDN